MEQTTIESEVALELDLLRAEKENLLEAQRLLEESRDRYAELFQLLPHPCLILDLAGVIREANGTTAALLKWDKAYLAGIPFRNLTMASDRNILRSHLTACGLAHDVVVSELHLMTRGGEPVPVRVASRRVLGGENLLITTLQDVSEQEQMAERARALLDAEKAVRAAGAAKDQFIAMLSHELRTPLTPVLMAVSAIQRRPDLPEPLKDLCSMITRNIEAESRLIDDLLDVTRISRGKMHVERTPIEVHRSVQQALDLLSEKCAEKHFGVTVALAAERQWTNGDVLRLRQVFFNLLQNAVKFTPPGGRINIRSWNRGDWIAVEISDSGVGIPPNLLPRLFVPFEQSPIEDGASRGGLGLGLAICRGLVELHGGRITASSQGVGTGARFIVDLPTTDQPAAVVSEKPSTVAETRSKRRILLVEDDQDSADTLADVLRDEGFQIRIERSLHAALETKLDDVDLLLSDVSLGDGSGLELMRHLQEKRPIKGIVLSGCGTEADIKASLQAGFSAHLVKPVTIEKLLSAIERIGTH